MRTFDYLHKPHSLEGAQVDALLAQLHEDKGRLEALKGSHGSRLAALEQRAVLESACASARIEGIAASEERLAALLSQGEPACANADEQEALGYCRALQLLGRQAAALPVESGTAVRLFEELYSFRALGDRSRYRRKDYAYVQVDRHMQAVPVSPVPAFETPLVFGGACDALALALDSRELSPALLAAQFTVDMLCIRPFDTGNGRIARLFADLVLRKGGFDICRYMSVDSLIEQRAVEYYDALNACTMGWDKSRNSYEPFALYWLDAVHRAYQALFGQLEGNGVLSKTERITAYLMQASEPVSKAQLARALPDVSVAMIENVLGRLVREGRAEKLGASRATRYRFCG
ncbi:MAG: Fic family protein [Coriobacteriales bacterium]